MRIVFKRMVITIGCMLLATNAFSAELQEVRVLYPKDKTVVGNKVNLVLDPAEIPMFRVVVNETPSPIIDTSQGAHALQGLMLQPGHNVLTVQVLAPASPQGKDGGAPTIVADRTIRVFNSSASFSPVPVGFIKDPFHTREHESTCSSCHRLEPSAKDLNSMRPSEVLCYTCHRDIPKGKESHGPAALFNCLACHNPELYPARYAFSSVDPWKVTKYTQSVVPMLFTLSGSALFNAGSATLISKAKAKDIFSEVLDYIRQNPGDKVRLEVHTDLEPLRQQKTKNGKLKGFKDNQSLSAARARTLTAMLKETGVDQKKLNAVGMGEKLPKSLNKAPEAAELNNRIEVVIYPPDVKVVHSQKLPVLTDRERVVVSLNYGQGPAISKLRVVEQVQKGMQYTKGSGYLKGRSVEPRLSGTALIWELGDMDANFTEALYYTVKKGKNAGAVSPVTRVTYRSFDREQVRDFDPAKPAPRGSTIPDTCNKCHPGIVDSKFKHGPVVGGYCTLCHDPHASENDAWLRKPVWQLCTTCHPDQGNGVHVVAGYVKSTTHPTRGKRDRARPGKGLNCVSCHAPHKAEHEYLFSYERKDGYDLCKVCHKK